jgi:hypothetical protein
MFLADCKHAGYLPVQGAAFLLVNPLRETRCIGRNDTKVAATQDAIVTDAKCCASRLEKIILEIMQNQFLIQDPRQ